MSALALRYDLRRDGPRAGRSSKCRGGTTQRLRLPDGEAKARLVGAVLATRCAADEELELFGQPVRGLKRAARGTPARPHRRRSRRAMGLISNLNAWENISLQAAYHGTHPVAAHREDRARRAGSRSAPSRALPRPPARRDGRLRAQAGRLRAPARQGAGARA